MLLRGCGRGYFLHGGCTCRRGVLAQTNVSDASRVYYETERINSHSHGAEAARSGQQSKEPHRAQSSAQRSSGDTALGWAAAWVADPNESLPLFLLATSGNKRSHPSSTSRSPGLQFLRSCCPSRALYIATSPSGLSRKFSLPPVFPGNFIEGSDNKFAPPLLNAGRSAGLTEYSTGSGYSAGCAPLFPGIPSNTWIINLCRSWTSQRHWHGGCGWHPKKLWGDRQFSIFILKFRGNRRFIQKMYFFKFF